DLVAITVAMIVAFVLRRSLPDPDLPRTTAGRPLALGLACLPAWLLVFCHFRLYGARFVSSRRAEFRRVVGASGTGVMVMMAVGYAAKSYVARTWLLLTVVCTIVTVMAYR